MLPSASNSDLNSAVVMLFDYGQSKKSTVTVKLPASLVEQISELNEVDPKYIERTIARILRDEIAVEKKLRVLQSPEDLKDIDRTGRFCGAFRV